MPVSASERQEDVKGIFLLLMSARTSLPLHQADELCLSIMDDCISSFQARHKINERETREAIVWEETSLAALVRLLQYLQGEIRDRLRDRQCAEQLKLCIDYLTQVKLNEPTL